MTVQADIGQAQSQFVELVERALHGDDVVVSRDGEPLIRLVPINVPVRDKRRPGSAEGIVQVSKDFDAPLPDDVLDSFEA
ncbi:MAG: prevent-host-death family protein [Rhodothermales bacterium]|jgi:prevent-host-death family protein